VENMRTDTKNCYCVDCDEFFPNALIPECPKCKQPLVETYHLQKGDKVYTIGAFLYWTGKKFELYENEDSMYYDGKAVNFTNDGVFIIL